MQLYSTHASALLCWTKHWNSPDCNPESLSASCRQWLTLKIPVVTLYTSRPIQPKIVRNSSLCICVYLRTNSDYFPIEYSLLLFHNRKGDCLMLTHISSQIVNGLVFTVTLRPQISFQACPWVLTRPGFHSSQKNSPPSKFPSRSSHRDRRSVYWAFLYCRSKPLVKESSSRFPYGACK